MSTGTEVATVAPQKVVADLATQYGLEPAEFEKAIVETCFSEKDAAHLTRAEFYSFLMVAHDKKLNPLLREIYAFRKPEGGIQAIVGVDGWANLINRNPQFDGMTFQDERESPDGKKPKELIAITCRMFRKDRSHPTEVTEYMQECRRETKMWKQWPARMLRHKATIQAARLAFGFAGIVDPDEAERIKGGPIEVEDREEPRIVQAEKLSGPTEEKRGPGRPRKAPPAPPEEPIVAATQDAEKANEIELVEYIDPDSGELRHVTVEEYDRLLKEEIKQAEDAEQARRAEEAHKAAAAEERRRKAEEMRRQLAELEGADPAPITPEQKAANGEFTQKLRSTLEKIPQNGGMPDIPAFLKRPKPTVHQDDYSQQGKSIAPATGPAWPNGIEDPDSFLKRLDAEFSRLDDGDQMQELWDAIVEPIADQMFPPDMEEAQKIMRHHSSRVAP